DEQAAVAAFTALPVRERDVTGLVRSERQRNAAQGRLHRVEAGGLGVDRDPAEVAGAGDPGVEPVEAAHGLVARAIDLGVARGVEPSGGERRRRELLGWRSSTSGLARRACSAGERE